MTKRINAAHSLLFTNIIFSINHNYGFRSIFSVTHNIKHNHHIKKDQIGKASYKTKSNMEILKTYIG